MSTEPPGDPVLLVVLTVLAAVATATSGGALFAFSSFVMPALARLEPTAGAAAMQSINVTAVRPAFMAVFFGGGLLAVAVPVAAASADEPILWSTLGAVAYVVGVIGVTAAVNVPLNTRLGAVSAAEASRSGLWGEYLRRWTVANHVRSIAGALAAVLFVVSLTR